MLPEPFRRRAVRAPAVPEQEPPVARIVQRLPWQGKLLTQPDRHDEARAWLFEHLMGLRRGLEAAAPRVASIADHQ